VISDVDLAYAAGVFDGEGSVSLDMKQKAAHRAKHGVLRVNVTNTCEELIDWFEDKFGGHTYMNDSRSSRNVHKWQAGARVARDFLQQVLPYLIVKRRQAEIAILFQSRKSYGNSRSFDTVDEQIEMAFAEVLKSLNKGIADCEVVDKLLESVAKKGEG
jgi:hypothetical protein